jgi:hypothetical protein
MIEKLQIEKKEYTFEPLKSVGFLKLADQHALKNMFLVDNSNVQALGEENTNQHTSITVFNEKEPYLSLLFADVDLLNIVQGELIGLLASLKTKCYIGLTEAIYFDFGMVIHLDHTLPLEYQKDFSEPPAREISALPLPAGVERRHYKGIEKLLVTPLLLSEVYLRKAKAVSFYNAPLSMSSM